jgi:hypothetical protein
MVIWKYTFQHTGVTKLLMPRGAKVLKVDAQNHSAVMWALVDPGKARVRRYFEVVLTGERILEGHTVVVEGDRITAIGPESDAHYVGTANTASNYVYHIFEVLR